MDLQKCGSVGSFSPFRAIAPAAVSVGDNRCDSESINALCDTNETITKMHKDGLTRRRGSMLQHDVPLALLYKQGCATGLSGGMWYKDHYSPGTFEARADGTLRTMTFPVFSAGQWAVTR